MGCEVGGRLLSPDCVDREAEESDAHAGENLGESGHGLGGLGVGSFEFEDGRFHGIDGFSDEVGILGQGGGVVSGEFGDAEGGFDFFEVMELGFLVNISAKAFEEFDHFGPIFIVEVTGILDAGGEAV
jgi:hypothetical protein